MLHVQKIVEERLLQTVRIVEQLLDQLGMCNANHHYWTQPKFEQPRNGAENGRQRPELLLQGLSLEL